MLFLSALPLNPVEQFTKSVMGMMPWLVAGGAVVLTLGLVRAIWGAKIKGWVGEWLVQQSLISKLNPKEYHVLGNLLLTDDKGKMTQIDHVVVSAYGVFVIETKYWGGWIFGEENDAKWTQMYNARSKKRVMNPLHQNARHVRVVRELLNLPPEHCHNLVYLHPTATLKSGWISGVFQKGLARHIQAFREAVFHPSWPARAVAILREASRADDKQAVAEHLAQVEDKHGGTTRRGRGGD